MATQADTPQASMATIPRRLPETQDQLLLFGKGQPYEIHHGAALPQLASGDLLVKIHAIGLNPIDWKSAAFGYGLPCLPSLNGREFVGQIIASDVEDTCKFKPGEWILAISTDYRDFRKAAFQEFAVVCCYNAVRIPHHVDRFRVASVGVAFVAAGLALGACLGMTFTRGMGSKCFNMLDIAKEDSSKVPEDVLREIDPGISFHSRPLPGDWILVYGASSTTAQIIIQLARRTGLKVAGVADLKKHRELLVSLHTDLLVDRTNLEEARRTIQQRISGSLKFAVDVVGSDTAAWCQDVLESFGSSQRKLGHLVVLTGAPKVPSPNVQVHQVPIKLFHEHQEIGRHLSLWLSELMDEGSLKLPDVDFVDGGLGAVNQALQRLRDGSASGKRLVVKTSKTGVMSV